MIFISWDEDAFQNNHLITLLEKDKRLTASKKKWFPLQKKEGKICKQYYSKLTIYKVIKKGTAYKEW